MPTATLDADPEKPQHAGSGETLSHSWSRFTGWQRLCILKSILGFIPLFIIFMKVTFLGIAELIDFITLFAPECS